jgi:RNA 2',3'-cyclic 3'-phosphodiesterase
MRLFVGFNIPSIIRENTEKIITELEKAQPRSFKPVNKVNLHITIEFIGDFPEKDLPLLTSRLSKISAEKCMVNCSGIGVFPFGSFLSPKVIWIGADLNKNISLLYTAVDRTHRELRINTDQKPYHPHLTIGRLSAEPSPEFIKIIEKYRSTIFGSFTAEAFHLYMSNPGLNGPVYSIIETYKLNPPVII